MVSNRMFTNVRFLTMEENSFAAVKENSQYQNWQANKHPILTVIELGLPVSESSTKISKFYAPIDSKHKFYKVGIEN